MSVGKQPAKKVPISTQRMWEMALSDLEHEEGRSKLIRSMPDVTHSAIVDCERRLRLRQAIVNAMDFLITNEADIKAVVAKRSRQS